MSSPLKRWAAIASAALVGIGASGQASAVLVNSVGSDFSVAWSLMNAGGSGVTVRGQAAFDITAITDVALSMTVSLNNLPDLSTPAGYNGGWASIGWSVDPDADGGSFTGPGTFFTGAGFDSIPSLPAVEVCIFAGNNCNGGGQGSLLPEGGTDSFSLILTRPATGSLDWTLDDFGAKFQTAVGSFEFLGFVVTGTPPDQPPGDPGTPGNGVPEPGTLLLATLALTAIVVTRRRKPPLRVRFSEHRVRRF